VYAAKDKERTEISMRGMQSVTILRRDKKVSWMLMPSHRMYSETDLARVPQQNGSAPPDDVSIESVGTETIEGHEDPRPTDSRRLYQSHAQRRSAIAALYCDRNDQLARSISARSDSRRTDAVPRDGRRLVIPAFAGHTHAAGKIKGYAHPANIDVAGKSLWTQQTKRP
jgi:hypothetical protein